MPKIKTIIHRFIWNLIVCALESSFFFHYTPDTIATTQRYNISEKESK